MDRIDANVRRELNRFGPAGSIGVVVETWPAAVGDSIARNAWPARVARDGTMHVATSSSAWAFELTQLAPTILARVRELAGADAPRKLRFAPGPLPEPPLPEDPEERAAPPAASPETRAEADRIAAPVADEELRELIARAAAASLSRAPGDRSI